MDSKNWKRTVGKDDQPDRIDIARGLSKKSAGQIIKKLDLSGPMTTDEARTISQLYKLAEQIVPLKVRRKAGKMKTRDTDVWTCYGITTSCPYQTAADIKKGLRILGCKETLGGMVETMRKAREAGMESSSSKAGASLKTKASTTKAKAGQLTSKTKAKVGTLSKEKAKARQSSKAKAGVLFEGGPSSNLGASTGRAEPKPEVAVAETTPEDKPNKRTAGGFFTWMTQTKS